MNDAKEEIRSRLNIEDVIGEYVQLKRAGRNFRGLSPFTGERTPSFFVSPEKQIWHDFSSSKGGDVFSFVMEVEGIDFRASLEYLAQKAGVDLSAYQNKDGRDIAKQKKLLLKINEIAADYYQRSLLKNQHAIEYVVKKRGINKQSINDFKIGYAPSSGDALVKYLTKKGFKNQDIAKAGLLNRFGGDLFRGRVMIALMDGVGQVIGFTGRALIDDPKSPKYLNTPQTLLYDKSRHVFGLSLAKEAIRSNNYAVIVEGNLDVLSSHQAGIAQVVATAGTAMTEYHLKALVRLSDQIKLAFDGDKAGLSATERAIPIAQSVGVELFVVTLPKGFKDPDELIGKSVDLWNKAIGSAEPAIDWLIKQYAKREDMESAVGKKRFTSSVLELMKNIVDPVEKEHYLKKVAKVSGVSKSILDDKMTAFSEDQKPKIYKEINNNQESSIDREDDLQDGLLAVSIVTSEAQDLFKNIDIEALFTTDDRKEVAKYLAASEGQGVKETPKQLQNIDTYVKILLLRAEARYSEWSNQQRYFEAVELLRRVETNYKNKQKDKLTKQLRNAEDVGDDTKADSIRVELYKLIKEMQSAKKKERH